MHTITRITVIVFLGVLSLAGCKKNDGNDPAPVVKESEPSYFTGYQFQPKTVDDDNVRVLVSFCDNAEPVDTEIGVYNFPPDSNADDDLGTIKDPGVDDNGDPNDAPTPDDYVTVKAKYTAPDGTKLSDFNKKKQFVVDLDKNVISILTFENADGTISYAVVTTTNAAVMPTEVCLKDN